MLRSRFLLLLPLLFSLSAFGAPKQYVPQQDAQAVAVAQAAFIAMGGRGLLGYQDSLASGTVTISSGSDLVSYPIVIRSKGLRETRSEVQLPKGTNVRIMNQGTAAILRPDGSVKALDSNNTFYEHVSHVPLLSLLSEYASGNVNLLYKGQDQVQGKYEDVVEIDFLPDLSPGTAPLYASMSRTLVFVNQATSLVDKIQRTTFYEGNQNNAFTEESYYSDYRLQNGILVPFHQQVFINGQLDTDLTLTSFTFNVGIPDSDFTIPQTR